MSNPPNVYADLAAEGEAADKLVADLRPELWALPTPAPGWTIAHQIAHLASVARLAQAAAADPEAFKAQASRATADFDAAVQALLQPYLALPSRELLARWRSDRTAATAALAALPPDQLVPWLARPLPAGILASAGIMELFAHGQDIADALKIRRDYTDRIRHLAAFGVRVWDFGYLFRGQTPPDVAFRFELTAPSGERWEFGPADSEQRITGPAVDFCLLVTRRRHRDDLALTASGAEADHWMDIAQAYRGSPGPGRSPGQFRTSRTAAPQGASSA
ncbi:MAG TPA: TIGR03084 family metal-binding protein [Streptosporangiaceae bacterium]|nr:TIGR03084 family metal-binding protein [Streptosporangiaceae bacterium]